MGSSGQRRCEGEEESEVGVRSPEAARKTLSAERPLCGVQARWREVDPLGCAMVNARKLPPEMRANRDEEGLEEDEEEVDVDVDVEDEDDVEDEEDEEEDEKGKTHRGIFSSSSSS